VIGLIGLAALGIDECCELSVTRFCTILGRAYSRLVVVRQNRSKVLTYPVHLAWKG
jgi:hypothetical protein